MAISTDVPIYTSTIGTPASTVSIPLSSYQGYKNLKIVINCGISSTGQGVAISFNGSSTGYSNIFLTGDAATPTSGRTTGQTNLHLVDVTGNGDTTIKTAITATIMSYSSSSIAKTVIYKSQNNAITQQGSGIWNNNNAITDIVIGTTGGNFIAGSTFSVYGIGTASIPVKATGGIISQDATYIYHTFTSTGAFVPTQNLTNVDYLVLAGGGGSRPKIAGGGGAGGYRTTVGTSGGGASAESKISLTSGTSYTISIGAGGSGYSNGTNSYISGTGLTTITSIGGGCGGYASGSTGYNPSSGGSGGGGAGPELGSGTMTGGAGTSAQGYAGADGKSGSSSPTGWHMGAGGGGAGGAAPAITATSILGGPGLVSSIDGAARGGGGGGGSQYGDASINSSGGIGGGGYGGGYFRNPTNGSAGTGGGGGGGGYGGSADTATSNGGSGIVIVRYAK